MSRATDPDPSRQPTLSGRSGPPPAGLVPFALADGTVIAVQDTGPRDSDEVVVLVAGWTQDHTSWEDVVAQLHRTRPGARVIAFDARGHGWSDAGPRGTWTIDQLADDVAYLLQQYAPSGRVVMAGHSLGGPIAMAFAERHPDLVRDRIAGMALVATSAAGLGKDIFGLSGRITAPAMFLTPFVTRLRRLSRARTNLPSGDLIAAFIRFGFYGPGQATAHNRKRTAAQTARGHPATTAALVDEMLHHDRLHTLGRARPDADGGAGGHEGRPLPDGPLARHLRSDAERALRRVPQGRAHVALRAAGRDRAADRCPVRSRPRRGVETPAR